MEATGFKVRLFDGENEAIFDSPNIMRNVLERKAFRIPTELFMETLQGWKFVGVFFGRNFTPVFEMEKQAIVPLSETWPEKIPAQKKRFE